MRLNVNYVYLHESVAHMSIRTGRGFTAVDPERIPTEHSDAREDLGQMANAWNSEYGKNRSNFDEQTQPKIEVAENGDIINESELEDSLSNITNSQAKLALVSLLKIDQSLEDIDPVIEKLENPEQRNQLSEDELLQAGVDLSLIQSSIYANALSSFRN
jgi:hypothetical protein